MIVYTIGHSTHPLDKFIDMLRYWEVPVLADVRSMPGSNRYPWFNRENLERSLPLSGITYIHIPSLGGRRKTKLEGEEAEANAGWKNKSFRSYADYTMTDAFSESLPLLEVAGLAYMCAEALPWRCHRTIISDNLTAKGWTVRHILETGLKPHRLGAWGPTPWVDEGNRVTYPRRDNV